MATRRFDRALNKSSIGSRRGCKAASGHEATQVMTLTRSLVAAWFCFNLTAGAPASSRVRQHLEPLSLKCKGFSSTPKMAADKS